MKELLKGKITLVTGGADGIGACAAKKFMEEGASGIVIVDINEEKAGQLARDLSTQTCRAISVKADVTNPDDVDRVFERVKKEFGVLDILLNNAGIARIVSLEDLTPEAWDRTYAINVKGMFLFARSALQMMKERRYGRIINMGSQAGKSGGLTVGADYASSKGAVLSLTKSLAKVAAQYNVTCNSVAPGLIATGMTTSFGYDPKTVPLNRIGTPEEVADAILFLASDMSRYITGACIDVNGGISMW